MRQPLVSEAFAPYLEIDGKRRIILFLIRHKKYRLLEFFGWPRRKQLENK